MKFNFVLYLKSLEHFKNKHLIVVGDLNSRVGILCKRNNRHSYIPNPDDVINTNGKKLLEICNNHKKFLVLNGLTDGIRTFDSKFTFYRGKVQSQVDIAMSNKPDYISSFIIENKKIQGPCVSVSM